MKFGKMHAHEKYQIKACWKQDKQLCLGECDRMLIFEFHFKPMATIFFHIFPML